MDAQQTNPAADILRNARTSAGLSYRQAADAAGVTFSWLQQLEAGRIAAPDPRKLARLAAVLGQDVDTVCGRFGLFAPELQAHLPDHAPTLAKALRQATGEEEQPEGGLVGGRKGSEESRSR